MMKKGSVTAVNLINNANDKERISHSDQHNEEGRISHSIQHKARSDDTLSVVPTAS
jgi:hypothetical protein